MMKWNQPRLCNRDSPCVVEEQGGEKPAIVKTERDENTQACNETPYLREDIT
jgi:hypothetical protein